jgi:hypothetical protein
VAVAAGAGLVLFVWAGFQVGAVAPDPPLEGSTDLGRIQVPADLPAPVLRFIAAVQGADASPGAPAPRSTPRYDTAIQQGQGRMRLGPVWLPFGIEVASRLGVERHSEMRLTWFRLGFVSGVDDYLAGQGRVQLAGHDLAEAGDHLDQGAYLAVNAEQISFPGSWIADPLIRWEPGADDTHARLVLTRERRDGRNETESFTATFNPATGFLTRLDTMRHKTPSSGKVPWRIDLEDWRNLAEPGRTPLYAAGTIKVTWLDEGGPWLVQHLDRVTTNVAVDDLLVW